MRSRMLDVNSSPEMHKPMNDDRHCGDWGRCIGLINIRIKILEYQPPPSVDFFTFGKPSKIAG